MVEWRVGCEDSGHLIVVRRMDVLINTVACELHLQREGRVRTHHRSLSPGRVQGPEGQTRCALGSPHVRDGMWVSPCNSHLGQMQRWKHAPVCRALNCAPPTPLKRSRAQV